MKILKSFCVASLVVALLPAVGVWAQDQAEEAKSLQSADLPSVDQVLNNYFDAVGGKKAYVETKSIVVEGELSIPEQGISGEFTVTQKAPNKILMDMKIEGIGGQRQGYDGETAWQVSDMTGAEIFEGEQAAQFTMQADIAPFHDMKKKYDSLKVTAKEEFDDKKCYVVTGKSEGMSPVHFYFDIESGLQVGMKMTQVSAMGEMEVVSKIGDYRDTGGVKMSYETTAELPIGMSFVTKIKSAKRNGKVDDSKFELPEEIKEIK